MPHSAFGNFAACECLNVCILAFQQSAVLYHEYLRQRKKIEKYFYLLSENEISDKYVHYTKTNTKGKCHDAYKILRWFLYLTK